MKAVTCVSNLSLLCLAAVSAPAFAQTSQPKQNSPEYRRNVKLASEGMHLATLMDRTTAVGISTIEATYEIYRKLCQEYEDLQGCSQLLYPATEHPTRAKFLETKSIAILKSKCEKYGYAHEDGEFCYQYGSALSHAGRVVSAIEQFKKRCAAPGGASSCLTVAFELPKLKVNKMSQAEAYRFAKRACELDINECPMALAYYSDGPDSRFLETRTEKLCGDSLPDADSWSCMKLADYKWHRGKTNEAYRLFGAACRNGSARACTYTAAISLARNDRLKANDSLRETCAVRARKVAELIERKFFDRICPELEAGRELAPRDSEFLMKQLRGVASSAK